MTTEHKPDPEFVEYLENQVRNPNLSAITVLRMERVFIDQREKYEAKLQAAREQEGGEFVATLNDARCFSLDDANRIMRLPPGTKLYTHPPKAQGVPEGWLVELIDRVVPDLSPEPNQEQFPAEWSLWADRQRIRQEIAAALLSTPAAPQADEIEPDLFWDYDNGEDSGQDSAYELADYCAQDLPHGETMEVVVMCAKRLPNRHMKIWVDEDDDVQWEWISPQSPEQGDGV